MTRCGRKTQSQRSNSPRDRLRSSEVEKNGGRPSEISEMIKAEVKNRDYRE